MKIQLEPINIQRSDDFEEEVFGIEDATIIMEILRSKLYSNPIRVLVQEYMCNARDAHREKGNETTPIEVTCPTHISPQFEVRDFGPGITPDRILKVFIKYGSSTKRDSNKQTGGYGLGSKSAWSYCDTFQVVSITDETGVNIKRSYACIIDETRKGKLVKLSADETTSEPCGTRIIVPVKSVNFPEFRKYAIQTAFFWKTRPIIHGESFDQGTIDTTSLPDVYSNGDNWKYYNRTSLPQDFATDRTFVVYDGIPYPLKIDTLKDLLLNQTIMDVLHNSCFGLFFDVGDITISANREEIHYTEGTKKIIAARVNQLIEDFSTAFNYTIQQETTFVDALVKYNELCEKNKLLAKIIANTIKWNGILLDVMTRIYPLNRFVRVEHFFFDDDKDRLASRRNMGFDFSKERISQIYINDDPRRSASIDKIRYLFQKTSNPEFNVWVISYVNSNKVGLTQNQLIEADIKINEWKEKYFINHIDFPKMSTVQKVKIPRGTYIPSPKMKAIKARVLTLNDIYNQVMTQEVKLTDPTIAGHYLRSTLDDTVIIDGNQIRLKNKYDMNANHFKLSLIFKRLNVNKLYLIKESEVITNPNLIKIEDGIFTDIVSDFDVNGLKSYQNHHSNLWLRNSRISSIFELLSDKMELINKNGTFAMYSKIYEKFEKYKHSDDNSFYCKIFNCFSDKIKKIHNIELNEQENIIKKKYPILHSINTYELSHDENIIKIAIEHLIKYINLIDNESN
jgi:hypothetical protein